MAQFSFNANNVAPDEGRAGAIPADWYLMAVDTTEMKPTSAGTGMMLACSAKVLEGQYKGRKVFFNFNLQNPNPQAVEIGQKQLSALCHATGILVVQDTSQFHNVPFRAKVSVRPAQGNYDESNDIKAFRRADDMTAISTKAPGVGAPAAVRPAAPPMAPPAQQFAAPAQQFAPPAQQFAQPAPQQFAPPPVQQAAPAPTAQSAQWAPPAAPQPWAGQPAPAQEAQPVQQAYQPAVDPNVQQAQQVAQPSWAAAPAPTQAAQAPNQMPVQSQVAAPAPQAANPNAGAILPPWMQQQAPQ